jgi:hypothetical protein
MPRAQPNIAFLGLPGTFGPGFVQNGLRSALELTRTVTVPFPSVVRGAPSCTRAERYSWSVVIVSPVR